MNNTRRKRIGKCRDELADILAEEDDARDSMPENLENSQAYAESEEASDHLQDAIDALDEIV